METQEEYTKRMRGVRPFKFFGITPQWRPGEKDVEGFCHDEVVRQFHDTRVWDDGGKRVEYMLDAWRYAEDRARIDRPTLEDVLKLGAYIEPSYNAPRTAPDGEFRHENVYIGDRMGVYPVYLREAVDLLVSRVWDVEAGPGSADFVNKLHIESFQYQVDEIETVDQWYLAFEWIHPFRDGNGRTGKVLHNWLSGTLDDPVLVPDYFGGGNP